jgi:hypothetical protein
MRWWLVVSRRFAATISTIGSTAPDAILMLEAFVGDKVPIESIKPPKLYSVAACGDRSAFDHSVTLP